MILCRHQDNLIRSKINFWIITNQYSMPLVGRNENLDINLLHALLHVHPLESLHVMFNDFDFCFATFVILSSSNSSFFLFISFGSNKMGRIKRIWYLSPMRACVSAYYLQNLRCSLIQAVSQKARSLAPPNGWACAVTICHDGMLEDTNSLDALQIFSH